MNTSPVEFALRDSVALVTMDDGKVNALSPAMLDALDAAFSAAEQEAKAVVLAGRPGRFCAGFDLRVMMSGADAARPLVRAGATLLMRIYAHPQPVVVACTGHALAGGALLAATGDTRFGAQGPFKIGLNEVQIGGPLPVFGQAIARDRLDPRLLTSAALQSRIFDPEGAVAAGFLDRLAPAEDLLQVALDEARRLARLPALAYRKTKARLRQPTVDRVLATLDADIDDIFGA